MLTLPSGKKWAVSKELMLEWVNKPWQEVPADLVVKSFKPCGISNAFDDGTENDAVYQEETGGREIGDVGIRE